MLWQMKRWLLMSLRRIYVSHSLTHRHTCLCINWRKMIGPTPWDPTATGSSLPSPPHSHLLSAQPTGLGIEPMALFMLGKCSTIGLHLPFLTRVHSMSLTIICITSSESPCPSVHVPHELFWSSLARCAFCFFHRLRDTDTHLYVE